jgi:predicted nucleotidyltransferase
VSFDARLLRAVAEQPHPLLFVTVSGAHLYGFPSGDSDWDLRGVHVLPAESVVGLRAGPDTVETSGVRDGLELDLVTHDVAKFVRLLLKPNGYVLEQLHSPLVLHTTPAHQELRAIARGCVTRNHRHHYVGFAHTQWGLLEKERPPRVKPLLYVYRVLLTGIHLMRTGVVEANLLRLVEEYPLPGIPELVARKTGGAEAALLDPSELDRHRVEKDRLLVRLEEAHARSTLPDEPAGRDALNDLLVRLRLQKDGLEPPPPPERR